MQDLYYSNMKFAWVPEDENFKDVSINLHHYPINKQNAS